MIQSHDTVSARFPDQKLSPDEPPFSFPIGCPSHDALTTRLRHAMSLCRDASTPWLPKRSIYVRDDENSVVPHEISSAAFTLPPHGCPCAEFVASRSHRPLATIDEFVVSTLSPSGCPDHE